MAKVEALVLCRFAEVQAGLLTVVSGGITRAFAPVVPTNVNPLHVAAMLYIEPDEIGRVFEIRICLKSVETARKIAEVVGAVQVAATEALPGEGLHVPVAINLSMVGFNEFGQVDVQCLLDNQDGPYVSFWIVEQLPPS